MRIKSRKVLEVLETIGKAALGTADIMLAIVTSPYGSSRSRLERQRRKIEQAREEIITELREKQKLYKLLNRLSKDGLTFKNKKGGNGFWQLTKKGEKELKELKNYYQKNILPQRKYKSVISDEFSIIVFDIPEKEKGKREWLRRKIVEMGFRMLQESVWIGKRKVPEEFVKDLDFCKLLPRVEIFTVSKTGSLSKLSL